MASIVVVDSGTSFGAELVGRLFGAGRDVLVAPTMDVAIERMSRTPPDVLFVRHTPQQDGFRLVASVREQHPRVVFVVGGEGTAPDELDGVHAIFEVGLTAERVASEVMAAVDRRIEERSELPTPEPVGEESAAPSGANGARASFDDEDLIANGWSEATPIGDELGALEEPTAAPSSVAPLASLIGDRRAWTTEELDAIVASDLFSPLTPSPLDASFFRSLPVPEPEARPTDALCRAIVAEVDGAIAAAVIDLDTGALLGVHNQIEFSLRFLDDLAMVTTTMFRGDAVVHIERTIHEGRGGEGVAPRFVKEIVLTTTHTHHLVRTVKNDSRAIMVVTPRHASLDAVKQRLTKLVPGLEANLP